MLKGTKGSDAAGILTYSVFLVSMAQPKVKTSSSDWLSEEGNVSKRNCRENCTSCEEDDTQQAMSRALILPAKSLHPAVTKNRRLVF